MNQNTDASSSFNQESPFSEGQGSLDPNVQALRQQSLSNVMQPNPMNPWLATSANQPLPALNMFAQQPQSGQMPWPTQISHPPQLQNAMLQMAPFNMPLLSQQIIQEAFSMSQPVNAADEPILLTALLKAKKSQRNFKEALNGLHGTNGHSTSLWKDYYLEHKDRLDDWIEMCVKKETTPDKPQTLPVTVKKPSPTSFKPLPTSTSAQSSHYPAVKRRPPLPSRDITILEKRRRSTLNSLSAPEPVFGSKIPPPNTAVKIPEPPSRSPSPPTIVIPLARGNKFTPEDRDFFIKFIGWRLRQNPDLNRQELCEMLAEKTPHHSAGSWTSFWSNNHDLPDKILALARGEIDRPAEERPIEKPRPNYKEITTSEDESGEESEQDGDSDNGSEPISLPVRRYSESDMGEKNGTFTEADLYFIAKYIASIPDWAIMTSKDRWEPFHTKYPKRSAKAWGEYYRRFGKKVLRLASSIQRETNTSIMSQLGHPSKVPQKSKRRLDDDEPSEDKPSKRTKTDDSE